VYWLQGYFELAGTEQGLTPKQAKIVQEHLSLVFERIVETQIEDTSRSTPFVEDPFALTESNAKVDLTDLQKEGLKKTLSETAEKIKSRPVTGGYPGSRDTRRIC
jgi:hypothetical protein